MKIFLLFLSLILVVLIIPADNSVKNFDVDSLISLMTVSEKIEFISGYKNFNIKGLKRLKIPQVKMADGPMGLNGHGKATAFPASICMAASWNPNLIEKMAGAIAIEAKSKGIGILLAPGVNMYRVPQCGRNFEYYGEDPFLASRIAVSFIKGVQGHGVIATVKHFVANNQDYDRHRVSSNIDERTLHEIYFPVFKAAVKEADVGSVMTSYNLLNGIHTSESNYLINEVLKKKWGFKGFVISDWLSVYSIKSFWAGLDMEMPRPQFMNRKNILPIIKKSVKAMSVLDDKVRRILETCNRFNLYGQKGKVCSVNRRKHEELSKQVALEGFVLLKNENRILPLNKNIPKRVLILGPNASYTPFSGGGAAMIDAHKMVSFLQGIKKNAPLNYKVDYLSVEGMYHQYSSINFKKFRRELSAVKDYDAVIVCVGFNPESEGEAFDRPFSLPKNQNLLINEVSKLNRNIIITINAGGGVHMPWIDKIKALLFTWYPGQAGGEALGKIIFGKKNPSGKLPISIEKEWKDNAAYRSYNADHAVSGAKPFYTLYGKPHKVEQMDYREGIFTGYRHFDKEKADPLFAFGYGLSYTSFKISDISVNKRIVRQNDILKMKITVENVGNTSGAETVQIYIRDIISSIPRPKKELKAFRKVYLESGEKTVLNILIRPNMFAFYHPDKHDWIVEDGDFEILVGNSSDNIAIRQKITYQRRK